LESNLKAQTEIVSKLQSELNIANKIKNEYENLKGQVNHLDTFKNELTKVREEKAKLENHYESQITELKEKIAYLQLTPAKRKKISVLNSTSDEDTILSKVDSVKDGGSF
jgi:S-adenosylmethionine hydrolase